MNQKEIIINNIISRRSIRKYTEQVVSEENVNTIIKAGMYAPSAVNKQPWHFVVFKEQKTFEQITSLHPNGQMLAKASKAILVCGDKNLAHAEGYIPCDCSAATQNMLLTAHALGLGAVWIGIYPRDARIEGLKKIFNLPEHIIPFSIISLGYPNETKDTPDRFKPDRIHYERW